MSSLKEILSYFYEFPLEKKQSQFSGEVEVSLHHGQYKLCTKNAIYSFGKKYTSFEISFQSLAIQQQQIESVLVLGFGLGSVVDLLENHPTIKKIVAVDADNIIIELAQKYLQSNLKNKVEYIYSDAIKYVQNNPQQFDLILFDVFIDELTPLAFMQANFLIELKKIVRPNGILLYSKIDTSFKNKIENEQFENTFSAIFPEAFSIDANGNKVFAWLNR